MLLQAQSSPAHTMDRFLPKKLQEAAAAATAAKAKAAGTAGKPEQQQATFAAGNADKYIERAAVPPPPSRPSPVASPTTLFNELPTAVPVSRPYITPMPAGIKPRRAILQQDEGVNGSVGQVQSKGHNPPLGTFNDLGQIEIEQGMDFLHIDGPDRDGIDDLDAPSSFCCPITTVSA